MEEAENRADTLTEKNAQIISKMKKTLEGPLSSLFENSLDYFKANVTFDFNIKNKIAIFWDYENFPIPKKYDYFLILTIYE